MKINRTRVILAAIPLFMATPAMAQAFPEGATTPSADEIRKYLSGKVFNVKVANGASWRLEYKDGGHFFVDTSTGFRGSGEWKAEAGQLCGGLRGEKPSCNDTRLHEGVLHLKRSNGEIIQYIAK